jgi:hypothetical protein
VWHSSWERRPEVLRLDEKYQRCGMTPELLGGPGKRLALKRLLD